MVVELVFIRAFKSRVRTTVVCRKGNRKTCGVDRHSVMAILHAPVRVTLNPVIVVLLFGFSVRPSILTILRLGMLRSRRLDLWLLSLLID